MSRLTCSLGRRSVAAALAGTLQLTAFAATAQTPAQPTSPSLLQPYVGIAVGRSNFDIDTTGARRADTSDVGYKLFGGVQFTPYLGVEAAAFDLGQATGALGVAGLGTVTLEGQVRGVSLAATATLPLSDAAALFARAGVAQVETRSTAVTSLGRFSTDDDSTQPVVGVGVRWNVTSTIAARLEWERVRARFAQDTKVDTDFVSLGVQARF